MMLRKTAALLVTSTSLLIHKLDEVHEECLDMIDV